MIYFDNAATSKYKPKCMIDAMIDNIKNSANSGRSSHSEATLLTSKIYEARSCIKNLLHATNDYELIFTKNTTEALNIAIIGYLNGFRQRTHVITSIYEHNSVLRPLKYLAKTGKIDVSILTKRHEDMRIEDIEMNIRNNTSLLVFNHISNVTGSSINLREISDISRAYNIPLLIDGAQSLGHAKLSLEDTPIDMLAAAGHKGLHGPQGSGFLLVNKNKVKLYPLTFGGTGTNSNILDMDIEYPESFEVGTINSPSIIGLHEAIKWTYANFDIINNTINKYSSILYNYLSSKKNIKLYSSEGSNVLSFNVDGYTSQEIAEYLNDNNIATRSGLHCAPLVHTYFGTLDRGMVRVSVGYNNTLADIDMLTLALDKIPEII